MDVTSDVVYLAMSLRNVGSGLAVLDGWVVSAEVGLALRGMIWVSLLYRLNRHGQTERLAELAAAEGRPAPAIALSIFVHVGEGAAAREESRRYLEGAYNVDFSKMERYTAIGSAALAPSQKFARYRFRYTAFATPHSLAVCSMSGRSP